MKQSIDIPLAPIEPLLLTATQCGQLMGLSRSMFYKMNEVGKVGPQPIRYGKCVRWSLEELRRWVRAGSPPRHLWVEMQMEAK